MTTTHGVDVLAFGAHPDDVELFCGGTLIRLAQLGHRVAVVDLTRGERASNGTVEDRAREAEAASAELGLAHRENLALPDTELAPITSQIERVVATIRRNRPELVLAPWCEDRHPDHVAASELVTRAAFFANVRNYGTGDRWAVRQVLYYALRVRMTPSFIVDTSAAVERKARAIACHASQVTRTAAVVPTLVNAPTAIAAIEARDRYYGSMIGTTHGEPLRAAAVLGIVDPVRHVRDNPFTGAHAFEPLR